VRPLDPADSTAILRRLAARFLVLAVLVTAPAAPAAAEVSRPATVADSDSEYLLDVWGTDQGLPNNVVSAIAQTPDGYLWCATYDGVVRFDGVRFLRIGPDEPADQQANRVMCLLVGRQGELWLGTEGAGLFRYTDGRFTHFAEPPGAAGNSVRSIVSDAAGNLWLGTKGGLGQLRNGRLQWFTDANGYANAPKSIWSVTLDRNRRVWAADWSNLRVFDGDRFETAMSRPELRTPVRTVYADEDGNVWAGMLGRAFLREANGKWAGLDEPGQFADAEIAAFCQTRSGDLWVGTRRGLFQRHAGRWTAFGARDGLPGGEVRALFEDREGNLWVGSGTGGLVRLKRRMVRTYGARQGLSDDRVLGLAEKPGAGLCVGLNDGRLMSGTAGNFTRAQESKGLSSDAPVNSLLRTRDGALWIGTFGNGLIRDHEGRTNHFIPSVGTPARIDKITALMEDQSGSVWVGSFYALYRSTPTNVLVPVPIDGREVLAPVTALLNDRAGGIWVSYQGLGLVRLFDGGATWLTRREGLPTHFVRALHEDKNRTLWIGTSAGLCAWKDGRLATFNKGHGLLDDAISQILEDESGHLWLGSSEGIMRVSRFDPWAGEDRRRTGLEVFACGSGEGMLSAECSGGFWPAGLKAKDGRLWFPTAKGLVMVDTGLLKSRANILPPPVHIEEMIADGEVVFSRGSADRLAPAKERSATPLVLPPTTRRLEFVYTALSFVAPERVRFRHRLEGYDGDWTDAGGARSVVFARLSPGDYRFQVVACNNDGVWNTTGQSLAFTIAAPFWQSWWFLSLAGLGGAGAIAGVVRVVSVRRLRRKLQRLEEAHAIEKERMRIAQDMHDELGGKLSRISFLSDMARRGASEESEATRQMDEVSEAARDVIRTVDEIVWAVSPRNDSLENLSHYICRHAEEFFELTPIELELELPPEFPPHRIPADARHNLFCAVKEALNNVLKHSQAKRVRIVFAVRNASFEVTVSDDGSGFAMAANAATTPSRAGHGTSVRPGNGLSNMRDRMESIQGICAIESQPGQGTRAIFAIRLK
jgi:ligand-binding sensor domain-containing protein/signal transduction histidine kinase